MLVTLLLLILEAPERLETVVPREGLEVVGVGAEVGVGGGVKMEEKRMAKKRMAKPPTVMLMTKTSTAVKEATQGVTVVVRSFTKRCDVPDRYVAFAGERAIRLKYAPTSSPSSPAKLTRVATTVTGFSAKMSKMPSTAMNQVSVLTSLVKGIEMRSLGRWGIFR